jgi:hypothetical protein
VAIRHEFEVIVGNIGTVYSGGSRSEAMKKWTTYQLQSKAGYGRAGGEDVTLMADGEPIKEYFGTRSGSENPVGIKAQVRRLPTGQIQIKIPLKVGRRGNPVRIESPDGNRLTRGIRIVERYGDQLLKRGNDPKFVAKVAREALGNWVQQATVIVDDGKGRRAYNPRSCNPMDTVRRDWLKKQIAAGKMEAKLDYSIEHDGSGAYDKFGGPWIPARLSSGYGDFVEGQMNFRSHDFTSKSGMAYRGPNGTISLIVHSNLAYTLRPKTH